MWKTAKKFEASDIHKENDEKLAQYIKNKPDNGFKPLRMQPSWNQPQTSWMFEVVLQLSVVAEKRYGVSNIATDPTFVCISADIPKYESTTKQFFFFGSSMSKNIYRNYSGETTLQFWLRGSEIKLDSDDPSKKIALIDILAPKRDSIAVDDSYPHKELMQLFSQIQIKLLKADGSIFRTFDLENPIVTNVEFGNVSYEDDAGMKISMTVHYDYWSVK